MQKELFSKRQKYNTPRIAEVVKLLDHINIIKKKAKSIEEGEVLVAIDNKEVRRISTKIMEIAN